MKNLTRLASAMALIGMTALYGCSDDDDVPPAPNEPRAQDTRSFTVDETALRATLSSADQTVIKGNAGFLPLAGADTDRWVGVLGGASYQIEVPRNWNGKLVLYAHGYRGEGAALTVNAPPIRKFLVDNGYAWAASSYSKNYYDVRAGVEDTNALALNFKTIAAQNGRTLAAPTRTYITGHSMGGHITGAAIDEENIRTAINKVRYDGAVPMCGVLGDTELFDFFAAYQVAAQQLAGQPATSWPVADWTTIGPSVRSALFTAFPSGTTTGVVTPAGEKLKQIVKNFTGGQRPNFDTGFALPFGNTQTVWGTFGGDGTVSGILGKQLVDTTRFVYQFDNDPALSAEETAFNAAAFRVKGDPEANRLRPDGLRWIPKTNGNFSVPVVSLHTLGDMYVPFSMEQIFKRRADALGTSGKLVQRAARGITHCDFTLAEQEEAFADMVRWEQTGTKPLGDDVLTPAVVADPNYGCKFSRAPRADDSAGVQSIRTTAVAACPAGSASPNF